MNINQTIEAHFDNGWDSTAVKQTLTSASRIVMVAHLHADGDAVGSLTGMSHLLAKATTAQTTMLLPDGCPDTLDWLPGADHILNGQTQPEACRKAIAEADLIILLDLNTFARTESLAPLLQQSTARRMLIDHHLAPNLADFHLAISEPEISSTCELVYWLMSTAFGSEIFTTDAATCLFTGICTDTGTFTYSNTRPSLYLAAASLLRYGIDPIEINHRIHNVYSEARLRFFGHAMDSLLTFYPDRRLVLMALPKAEMEAYGVSSADISGLINEVMRLRDIDCAVLAREEGDCTRVSFRSRGQYDVSQIASQLFGGGGHERAAGATSSLGLAETMAAIKHHFLLLLLPLLLIVGTACRRTPVVDLPTSPTPSVQENLINANRYIAGSEATQIEAYLARRNWQATQIDGGTRVHLTAVGHGSTLACGDTVSVVYTVEDLGGTPLYTDRTDTLCVGRLQPNRGIDMALRSLRRGSDATVILPSEQAFGVLGDGGRIGTRMVLVYHLKINN
ncbi:MAG: DHH family phosphoesterase [Bacteroidales bacterium]|nr:DHH family phosphoesterase [Bacteroidales bacterium]